MRTWWRIAPWLVCLSLVSCRAGGLLKQYEYEEEMYLALDGSATIYVNASVPGLAVLRGADLDPRPGARLDRARVRSIYSGRGVRVTRVSSSRRHNRRFVHVRLDVDDVRHLGSLSPFSWSRYTLDREKNLYVFRQTVGASARGAVPDVGWTGDELVAFRVHLPSKIQYHDAPSRRVERGNILVWEQSLTNRRAGVPLAMEARMETESILYRTLWLFALTGVAVAVTFALLLWWIVRRGREPLVGVPAATSAAVPDERHDVGATRAAR